MRHAFVFTLCLIFFCGSAFSQNCPPSTYITFTTQEQVDNFVVNYPNCTQLTTLRIGDGNTPSTITNLEGLSQITQVQNYVYVQNNPNLTSLNGLENISYTKTLSIRDNETLTNLGSLGATQVETIAILNNDNLINLNGLQNLSIELSLQIRDNDVLTSLEGVEQVTELQRLSIENNDNLTNLDELQNLTSVTLDLRIEDNDALTDIEGLGGVTGLADRISIENNPNLVSLNGLQNISGIETLTIRGNAITSLGALGQITEVNSLFIDNNDNLISFNGLQSLSVTDYLSIRDNDVLNSIEGLEGTTDLRNLRIISNSSLINLKGLDNLQSVVDVSIHDNNLLSDLSGLENLDFADEFYITDNDGLISLGGLESLTIGELEIKSNDNLTGFNGLRNSTVTQLLIEDNNSLINMAGLESLTVSNRLEIRFNDNLVNLEGFGSLDNTVWLQISANDNLTSLSGLENATELFYVSISGNDNLLNLTGLDNLIRVNGTIGTPLGSLTITGNNTLFDISALSNLTHLGIGLSINNNSSLTNLTGLENVTLYKTLRITDNSILSDISALNTLSYYGNIENLRISGNANLSVCSQQGICYYLEDERLAYIANNATGCTSIDEVLNQCDLSNIICPIGDITFTTQSQVDSFWINYPGCAIIDGNLTISSASITNVNGLHSLLTVDDNLNICDNSSLTSLVGLSNVTVEGDFFLKNNDALIQIENRFNFNGGIYIEDNDALTDILNIAIRMSDATYLRITNNPNLFRCSQYADPLGPFGFGSICNYLWENNPTEILNNSDGCNSVGQVLSYCSMFPITLTYFRAKIDNKTALLEWQTATETNNTGFEIQRSIDGINWKKIAWQDGRGTTATAHTYTYRDENPLFGTSYYRLKQVDFDGAFEYTDIVQVNYQGRDISIYPNPVKNTLHISDLNGEEIQHISIYDQTGREIHARHAPGNIIDVAALSPGMYILKIAVKGEVFCRKFIVNQ